MKRVFPALLALLCLLATPAAAAGESAVPPPASLTLSAPAALLMEKTTGAILYEQGAHTQYEPASVTKVMTLLLVMEAIDSGALDWEDTVTASARACSMGGSQIWLKENETLTVREMVKAVTVASANDCSVALAEHLAGSEEAFVARMNQRAHQLGMEHTTFLNCTGLPAPGHVTCAHDIALMSRELILRHPAIREFTTIWMDTLRDGQFQLTNTNKLVRFFEGTTGLKTGSTDGALYCISATAERDGMELIAVVLHAPTPDQRFDDARALLSHGFANYTLLPVYPDQVIPPVPVLLGEADAVQPVPGRACAVLLPKAQAGQVTTRVTVAPSVEAPVEPGQKLGELTVCADGTPLDTIDLIAAAPVERLGLWGIFRQLLAILFMADT